MDNSPKTPDTTEDEVHLLDYLIVLAKHSRMIIYTTAVVTVLIYLILCLQPNKYKAQARMLQPQQNMTMTAQLLDTLGGSTSKSGGGGGMGGLAGLLGMKSPADYYVGILTGDTVFNRIIERFNLRELYKKKYNEELQKVLGGNTKIEVGKKDGIVSIEVTDVDPKRAADMANAFVEELDNLLHTLSIQEARGHLAFLEKERAQANINLSKAEEAMRSFSEQNNVIQIDTQAKGMLEYIANLRASIDAKEVEIQVMRQQATPLNYDIIRLETEKKGLKEKLLATEKQLDSCVGDVCLPTNKMPKIGMEYIRLYREAKFQETIYELYTKLVEMARLDMVNDTPMVQLLDKALPPEKKSNKRLLPTLVVGMAIFVIMIMISFAREYVSKTRIRPEEKEQIDILRSYLQPYLSVIYKLKKICHLN